MKKSAVKIILNNYSSDMPISIRIRNREKDRSRLFFGKNKKIILEYLNDVFPEKQFKFRYDKNLFCNCGCSPGYRVLIEGFQDKPHTIVVSGLLNDKKDIRVIKFTEGLE